MKPQKFTPDELARFAIAGIGPGEVSDKLTQLEKDLDQRRGPLRRMARKLAQPYVDILRQEINELALAYAKSNSDSKAGMAREDFYQMYLRMVEEHRSFRSFLAEHCESQLAEADATNMPLVALAKKIILAGKG